MHVDPSDPDAEQSVLLQETENFFVVRCNRGRQPLQIAENVGPGSKIAASNFADHERMHQYLPILNCLAEFALPAGND